MRVDILRVEFCYSLIKELKLIDKIKVQYTHAILYFEQPIRKANQTLTSKVSLAIIQRNWIFSNVISMALVMALLASPP